MQDYTLKIIRSSRKTIEIQIKNRKLVVIRVPKEATQNQIDEVLKRKEPWIEKHLKGFKETELKAHKIDFKEGAIWHIVGEAYSLNYHIEEQLDRYTLNLQNNTINIQMPRYEERIIKKLLQELISRILLRYVYSRVDVLSEPLGVEVNQVKIKKQKTLWGSCSTKKNINMNMMIAFAPLPVIDYLLVHELCHLKEMNHSNNYWALVASIIPDHKVHRDWLKKHNYLLKPDYF